MASLCHIASPQLRPRVSRRQGDGAQVTSFVNVPTGKFRTPSFYLTIQGISERRKRAQKCICSNSNRERANSITEDANGYSPKFVKFTPRNSLRDKLIAFERRYDIDDTKTLVVRSMNNSWIEETADLLTESFADAMGYLSVYKTFLKNQIRAYLKNHIILLPKTIILIGILEERKDASTAHGTDDDSTQASALMPPSINDSIQLQQEEIEEHSDPKHEKSALIGTVEVSFSPSTRSTHLTLNPPPDLPYLCNMAVQPHYRGSGYGRLLLQAAEDVIKEVGYKSVFLHVRHIDIPACRLYEKSGFQKEGEDWPIISLVGMDRRYLLKKSL